MRGAPDATNTLDTIGIQPFRVLTQTSSFASMEQKSQQNPGYQTLTRFYPDEQVREGACTHGPRWAAAGGRDPPLFPQRFSVFSSQLLSTSAPTTNEFDTWLALH